MVNFDKTKYPRPQFERNSFINLNGTWTLHVSHKCPCYRTNEINTENVNSNGFEDRIIVPFAPETYASGLEVKDIIDTLYYQRTINIPQEAEGKRVILNFGAVFYHCEVFIDGVCIGFHDGGSSSFSFDITEYVKPAMEANLVVKTSANLQDGSIPSGKQSSYMTSYTCFYHRTSGIWQTVWIEIVDKYSLTSVKTVWNEETSEITFFPEYRNIAEKQRLSVIVKDPTGKIFKTETKAYQGLPFSIKIATPLLWEPGDPNLYDITYTVINDGETVDKVHSYCGLRTVEVIGNKVYLNGKSLYQRLVLDQGFYPDTNWTSPNDEALENDIRLSMAAGFNGARLHQKVFEERFFYHADKLGYLVWAESPSWGLDYNNEALPQRNFLHEWIEIVKRDLNHPSIITWTPLNETYFFKNPLAHRRLHKEAYEICKALDPTRPVNDASGYIHYITDLWTVHTYIQNPKELKEQLEPKEGKVFRNYPDNESSYTGQPYFVDEYGGVKWDPSTQEKADLSNAQNLESWGYGKAVRNEDEFFCRVEELTNTILSLEHISGYCYTQLTDVEQEKNGVYFYSREKKFDIARFNKIFSKKPSGYEL